MSIAWELVATMLSDGSLVQDFDIISSGLDLGWQAVKKLGFVIRARLQPSLRDCTLIQN